MRRFLRWLLGVRRDPIYWLPWMGTTTLLLTRIESRFRPAGECPTIRVQTYDRAGRPYEWWELTLFDNAILESRFGTPGVIDYGLATVSGFTEPADVIATYGEDGYCATHGRGEFIEVYPWWSRWLLRFGLPAHRRTQFVFPGMSLLVVNLSNVPNTIRMDRERVTPPPRGARRLTPKAEGRIELSASAWFGYYVIGGDRSVQHVK